MTRDERHWFSPTFLIAICALIILMALMLWINLKYGGFEMLSSPYSIDW